MGYCWYVGGRARTGLTMVLVAASLIGVAASPAAAATVRAAPDLAVTSVSNPPATARNLDQFRVSDTTRNVGSSPAGGSITRYYLSKDTRKSTGDVKLPGFPGSRAIEPLGRGRHSRASRPLAVPKIVIGRYRLLACADDLRKVREANESNNCRASRTTVKIRFNQPPVMAPTLVTTMEDVSVSITLGAVDPDGDRINYQIPTGAFHGRIERVQGAPSLRYFPTHNTNGPDGFLVTASDGRGGSATAPVSIDVQAVDDTTRILADGTTLFYTRPGAEAVDPGVVVTDPDDVLGATVSITTNFKASEDMLSFVAQPGINGSYDSSTGVLTFTGAAHAGAYRDVLRSVAYENITATPTGGTRSVTFSSGTDRRSSDSRRIVLNAPVVTTSAGAAEHSLSGDSVPVDPGLTVTDADDTYLEGAKVAITSGFVAGDDLLFADWPGIIYSSYDASTGVLTLDGTASVANYQQALRSVEFFAEDGTGPRTVTFTAGDGKNDGPPASRQVSVGP